MATNILTNKSPNANVIQFISVPKNEIEKNKKVSIIDPINDDIKGAANQTLDLSLSKILTSISCAIRNAIPDPNAILIEIKSE